MKKMEMLGIEVSSYCGAKCIMCPQADYKYKNKFMSFELFKKAVGEGLKLGVKTFSLNGMGDSFLDPGLKEKLEYLKEEGGGEVVVMISTTGDKIQFDLIKYIDVLKFSNYGLTKAAHEAVHGTNFENSQSNIKKAIQTARECDCYTHMTFLVLPQNEHEMEAWKAEWDGKVDEVIIWKPHNYMGYCDNQGELDFTNVRTCGRPFNSCIIKVNGMVSACCMDWSADLIVGNLNTHSLSEILESAAYREIRHIHQTGNFKDSDLVCKNCDQIIDRTGSLVYSSKSRKVGATVLTADDEVRYSSPDTGLEV